MPAPEILARSRNAFVAELGEGPWRRHRVLYPEVCNFEQTAISCFGKLLAPEDVVMNCASCGSSNESEFNAEINVHFRGLKNLDNPGVLAFPKILICLDCGFSRFTSTTTELAQLAKGTQTTEPSLALRNCA